MAWLRDRFQTFLVRLNRLRRSDQVLLSVLNVVIGALASVSEIRERLKESPNGEVYVVDTAGRFLGAIALRNFGDSDLDPDLDALLNAADLLHRHPMVLELGDGLEKAITLLEGSDARSLPVVDDTKSMRLVGVLDEVDAIRTYNQALLDARAEEHGGG